MANDLMFLSRQVLEHSHALLTARLKFQEARVAELEAERLRLRLVIENGISGAENLPAFGDGPDGFLHDEWLPDARHALKEEGLDS